MFKTPFILILAIAAFNIELSGQSLLGAEISIMERFYNSGPSSFSINGGVIYKFGK